MTNNTKLPTYPVEIIYPEEIVIETPRLRLQHRTRFQQFIDNVALAIITGSITEEAVYQQTTQPVFDAIQLSLTRFDEMNELYSSRSTLEGELNEYLDKESFSFRNTPSGYAN